MTIDAHFDGEVFIPDGPVDLPVGQKVRIELKPVETKSASAKSVAEDVEDLLEALSKFPVDENWPPDGAKQVDHYLYGTPKVP